MSNSNNKRKQNNFIICGHCENSIQVSNSDSWTTIRNHCNQSHGLCKMPRSLADLVLTDRGKGHRNDSSDQQMVNKKRMKTYMGVQHPTVLNVDNTDYSFETIIDSPKRVRGDERLSLYEEQPNLPMREVHDALVLLNDLDDSGEYELDEGVVGGGEEKGDAEGGAEMIDKYLELILAQKSVCEKVFSIASLDEIHSSLDR